MQRIANPSTPVRFRPQPQIKMKTFEIGCLVIGGGVAGLSVARTLSSSVKDLFLIDSNPSFGQETSSRNSEVIHAGIYYRKDSLKSKLSVSGKELLYEYLSKRNIPFNNCGKYVLAVNDSETEKLSDIVLNAKDSGVNDLTFSSLPGDYNFLKYNEAIFSPSSGVMDSHTYMQSLLFDIQETGGNALFSNKFLDVESSSKGFKVVIKDLSSNEVYAVSTKLIINCAGIEAAGILSKLNPQNHYSLKMIKGEYYSYGGKNKVNHLIYPIPTSNSLGVHVTIDMGRGIKFGPSAYEVDKVDYSISERQKNNFLESIRKYWPSIKDSEIYPGYSGIRATIAGIDDFIIDEYTDSDNKMISLLGYVSPGLTSSLSVAKQVKYSADL